MTHPEHKVPDFLRVPPFIQPDSGIFRILSSDIPAVKGAPSCPASVMKDKLPIMQIKNVVFDYGSVLVWPPSSTACSRIAEAAGISKQLLMERYFSERSAYDRDTISNIEYWYRITRGYPAAEDDKLLHKLAEWDVEIWSEPNEATVNWLPILKKAGLTLAVLSNMPESFCSALEERDLWLQTFNHRIFSGRVKLNKPEPAIYQLLLDTLSTESAPCLPEEVLFLDDLKDNVDGARQMGINAELYNVFTGGLTAIAEKYGLPIPEELPPSEDRLRDSACAPHHHY
ncbi:MAG: hypothetical protein DRZ90_16130 [Spirochaetes bacterium]|nr:MAG: hypothetical protein DRZ90_16130 [Spirochaetota bacterium]